MNDSPPPLGPLAYGLIPLALVGLFGLVVPLVRVEFAPRRSTVAPAEEGARVPYRDELAAVVERAELDPGQRRAVQEFHERLQSAMQAHGGILPRDRARVDDILARYRPK